MKLILINGPAGVGKTTVAKKLHESLSFSFLLDLDNQRDFISHWRDDREKARILSFDIALALAETCLKDGVDFISGKAMFDTVLKGQEKNPIDMFIDLGRKYGAEVYEVMLWADKDTVLERADKRGYEVKNHLSSEKIAETWEDFRTIKEKRNNAIVLDTTNLTEDEVSGKVKEAVGLK
jgi:broad-specificity NMP kinase